MKRYLLLLALIVILSACKANTLGSCSTEAKLCPDGSSVNRQGLNCEFAPCPSELIDIEELAEQFVLNSPTYVYDGSNLKLQDRQELYCPNCAEFTYSFISAHGGYGDREGQVLTQVAVKHSAVILIESGSVASAVLDNQWDMLTQSVIMAREELFHECTPSERGAACTKEYDPVCGVAGNADEETFGNACTACADPRIQSWNKGECTNSKVYCQERDQDCPELWLPVCGYTQADPANPDDVDEAVKTYANYCLACNDEQVGYYIKGECA